MLGDTVAFERFRLIPGQRALYENGAPVHIGPRALDILIRLADAGGAIVSQRDLLEAVWPAVTVDPAALRVHISALRKVLGDGRLVMNVPGRGYQLMADLRQEPVRSPRPAGDIERLGRLFGRKELIRTLLEDLPKRQFLSLVGPGGVGKTAIAQALVARLSPFYGCSAVVDLGAVASAEAVAQAAGLAFGQTFGETDPQAALAAYLRSRRCLLVLDNCEHVILATTTLAEALCSTAPGLDILTTSREPLLAKGEWVYRVPPLATPSEAAGSNLDQAGDCPSMQLFIERARARGFEFELSEEEATAIADICRRVEGLPLAIELAAAWCELYPPSALAKRLEGGLLLRGIGRRDAPARQRSLRHVVDWSYNLLKEEEQALFRRLSVFAGDFTPEAAAAVAGGDPNDTLQALAGLVSKSLVAASPRAPAGAYHLLMAPKAYGAEALEQSGQRRDASRRHLLWVLERLRDVAARWRPNARSEWLPDYIALIGDLRAAAAWALTDDGDPDLAHSLTCESVPLWFHCSLTFEGRALCERALAACEARGGTTAQQLQLLTAYGVCLMFARTAERSLREVWTRVLTMATREGVSESAMLAHWGLWLEAWVNGDLRVQLGHARAFSELAEARDSGGDRLKGERMLAAANYALGRLEPAAKALELSLSRPNEGGGATTVIRYQFDQVSTAQTLLARIYWLRGRHQEALAVARDGVAAAERSEHGLSLAFALLEGPAHIGLLNGDAATAHQALDRHEAIPEAQGLRGAASAEILRALAWAVGGEHDRARDALSQIFSRPAKTSFSGRFPTLIGQLCDFLVGQGLADLAEAIVADARARFVTDPEDVTLPELIRATGVIAAARGDYALAISQLRSAVSEASRRGLAAWEQRAVSSLAQLDRRNANRAKAVEGPAGVSAVRGQRGGARSRTSGATRRQF
jgi:predicted ATPase/DNA-binding winged helix-turn-helix (wHTH) protein